MTLWYFDEEERRQARATGAEALAEDRLESEAIEAEIQRFESRFGGSADRHERRGATTYITHDRSFTIIVRVRSKHTKV